MNKTAKNSIIYFVGTVTMGVMGLVSTMILTRFLPQKVYAMNGLLATFHTIVTMLVSFGYDSAYMRFYYKHPYTQKRYMAECLKIPAILFAVTTLLIIAPGQHIIKLVFDEKLSAIALIGLIVYLLFSFLFRFSQLTARMEEHATNYVISNFVGKTGFMLILVILFYHVEEISFDWVLWSHAITAIVAITINVATCKKITHKKNSETEPITGKDLFSYGAPYMVNNVIILIVPLMEKLIIRELAGWDVLSIFTAASIFQTVIMLIVNTLINIWNPIVYKHCENEKKFKPILHTFGLAGTMILAIGTALCILLRRWLVLILDESYFSVYVIAPAMLLAACFNILSTIYSVGINIKKKTGHLIIGPILQVITSVALCYLLIPKLGLVGVGISSLASIGVSRAYRTIIGLRLYNTGQSEAKAIMLILVSIVCAVIALFKTSLYSDILLSISLLAVAAIIINKETKELIKTILALIKPAKKANVEETNEKNSAF